MVIWQNVEKVCILAEMESSLVGLKDSAMIRLNSASQSHDSRMENDEKSRCTPLMK